MGYRSVLFILLYTLRCTTYSIFCIVLYSAPVLLVRLLVRMLVLCSHLLLPLPSSILCAFGTLTLALMFSYYIRGSRLTITHLFLCLVLSGASWSSSLLASLILSYLSPVFIRPLLHSCKTRFFATQHGMSYVYPCLFYIMLLLYVVVANSPLDGIMDACRSIYLSSRGSEHIVTSRFNPV